MNKTRKLLLLSSSCLAVLISLSNAYGQEQQSVLQCTIYNTEALKVIHLVDQCTSPFDAIAYYLGIGYKIAGIDNGYVFMTK